MKNFEKYKTVDERVDAHDEYCQKNHKCKNPNTEICIECFARWLELEAEDEKLEPCPFCNSSTEVTTDEQGYYGVSCIHCDYTSERYEQRYDAVDAHNRVARAVREAKK